MMRIVNGVTYMRLGHAQLMGKYQVDLDALLPQLGDFGKQIAASWKVLHLQTVGTKMPRAEIGRSFSSTTLHAL